MDRLPDKAPVQKAVAAPGCQELAVLLTEPGSSIQRDFATMEQKSLFPQHKWGEASKPRTNSETLLWSDPSLTLTSPYSPRHFPANVSYHWKESFQVSCLSRVSLL